MADGDDTPARPRGPARADPSIGSSHAALFVFYVKKNRFPIQEINAFLNGSMSLERTWSGSEIDSPWMLMTAGF